MIEPAARPRATAAWLLLALLAAAAYLLGLGGQHIPKNGDESVYMHIARLTAGTGQWLPLQSEIEGLARNTKPPLLFWQAMVAGSWGEAWSLWRLRLPSYLYTLASALLVGALAARLVARPGANDAPRPPLQVAALAVLVYLAFFSTYRYSRPYLTSAPETFWMFAPFFAIAWSPARVLGSRLGFPLLAGVALGIACLYKSFALVLPVALALGACYQVAGPRGRGLFVLRRAGFWSDVGRVLLAAIVATALFALWFVVDPAPAEVWREFVVGENAGKFNARESYLGKALAGSGSIWGLIPGYAVNAGLLMPVVVGLLFAAWRARSGADASERVLWLWLLVLLLVFMLPSQRSARYLVAAMPALAVLMVLHWPRIARGWFIATLLMALLATLFALNVALGVQALEPSAGGYSAGLWLWLLAMAAACVAGLVKDGWTRPVAALISAAFYVAFAWVTAPLEGPAGRYDDAVIERLRGEAVMVPSNFNGDFERYQFLLPGARIEHYFAAQPVDFDGLPALLAGHRFVIVQRRVGQPPCADERAEACRVVAARWDIRSRQTNAEIRASLLRAPQDFWFAREYLVERLAAAEGRP
ncbi:ArnT family glycosyltransferase [Rivibacter subsaxonicus]|uniref:4-amino-4-deoxy-L-arabinose transferase-like glycosyltransferase n=1 Tax=Rivibacter subsaxonicus TaxID=457575 RepID=A0A4Q7VG19_9BURK|nr:glycosyl transferase [Rivibacter subsaxonicus]RZT94956.1 4-amino-4-deoxy-L-arabinose transferase-like glycosyltransferase [Rivibacter subsaxonicus]